MVRAVRADAVVEQNVRLFRLLEHRVLAEHKVLRRLLGKHQQRHGSVELAHPHVYDRHRRVLQSGVQVVVLHLALGVLPIRVSVAAGAAGRARVLDDHTLDLLHTPADVRGSLFVLDEAVEFVQQVLPPRTGNFDALLGCRCLSRNQEISEAADSELPVFRVVEVRDRYAVLRELAAQAQEVRMELRPLAQHLRELLGNDHLRLLPLGRFADLQLHVDEPLKRRVQVHVRGHRGVKVPLRLAEVQVGPAALAR